MITVRVHRQPVKEVVGRGKYIRTKKPTETRELQAELVKGRGIWVYWDMCGPSIFSKSTGVGRGKMRDWIIGTKDLQLLHAEAK